MFKSFSKIVGHEIFGGMGIVATIVAGIGDASNAGLFHITAIGIYSLGGFLAWDDTRKKEKFYKKSEIHLPVVINVDSPKSAKHIFNQLIKKIESELEINNYEDNLKKYLNIVREDLIYEYGIGLEGIYNQNKLFTFLHIISYNLNQIQKKMDNKIVFHIAYYTRPSVAFALGEIFKDDGVVVYQNNPDKDVFDEVAKTQNRNYKTNVKNFEKFDVKKYENNKTTEVLLVINASSHKVNLNASSLKKYQNRVILDAKHNGTIGLNEDWMQYVKEIFTILNELQTKYSHIVIAHAMPESIALLVGMAINEYWNVTITQYDNLEYKKVYNMSDIKLYS